MTALTISHLPLAVGGAVASTAGRLGLWAIGRFARAPLAYTGIFAMTTLSVMAASNALYHQAHRHPSPFFFSQGAAEQPVELQEVQPVPPPARRKQHAEIQPPQTVQQIAPETTGSVPEAGIGDGAVGNAKVYAVQKKLYEMRLFAGKIDGYYGPMTADAIRKFEAQTGRTPEGALSNDVMNAILAAPGGPSAYAQPEPAPLAPAPQMAEVQPAMQTQPANIYVAPAGSMATPVTQQAEVPPLMFSQPVQQQQPVLVARQVESGPEAILDDVADGAAGVFDSVASSVQGAMDQPSDLRQVQAPAQAPMPPANLMADAPPAQKPVVPANATSSTDPVLVAKVQRGLASLGFLAGSVDGVPGEATAKAVRNFEVYYNYDVTGKVTPQLLQMLQSAGAVI